MDNIDVIIIMDIYLQGAKLFIFVVRIPCCRDGLLEIRW